MNRFSPLLKEINNKLDLPQKLKSKIILEISADLNDLFQSYLAKGLNEKEALRKAEEKFGLSDEALIQLRRIHEVGFRRLVYNLSQQAQTWLERVSLLLIILLISILGVRAMFVTQFFQQSSILVLPVMGVAFVGIILSFIKFYNLYIKKDHNIQKLRTGLTALISLGGLSLFVGIGGYFLEIYLAGGYTIFPPVSFFIAVCFTTESGNEIIHITEDLMRSSSVGMAGLLVTILIFSIWFFLLNKVLKIEQAESEFLLAE
jgi:hypothetical protein